MDGDSEAGPHHGVIVDLISQPDPRREEFLAGGDPEVAGVAPDAAQQHVARSEVITVKLECAVARHQRIVFVAETEGCSELVSYAIAVPDEKPELPFPGRRFDELVALA